MRGERMKSLADGGGDGGALSGEKDMGKGVVVNASARKRGAASVQGIGGTEKVPSPSPPQCRSKKTTLPPTTAHHHRRSPSLHIDDDGVTTPAGRTLRQSASFSGGITATPRPGSQAIPTLRGKAINLPGKAARHSGPSNSRRVSAGDHHGREVEEDHNVQVFIRARPVNSGEVALEGRFARCVRQENAQTIAWLGQPESRFTFDHVAGEFVTQGELFRVAGLPMVDNCMAGYNSCMFAYGQTGSGKTHTMMGDIGDFENRGMTPRVFEYLFARIRKEEEAQKQGKLKYKCRCSFLEIYNEQISDLLEPSSTNLQMREDAKKGVFVEGLLEVEVQSVEDVLNLLLLGATNRKVAATNMNRESSRSHSVFTCVIESQWECNSMINFRFRRLNLVDLAGSERQKDTGADEERLREAASINKSLSTLGLVIMVLVDIANGKPRHVPYRDSKLTFLLQDSLGGNSKTTIIANISPSSCASSETLSTLKFAQRAKFIRNNAVINEELASEDVKGLLEQIHQLKGELARIRRLSVTRIPSMRLSGRMDASISADENTADALDSLESLILSPTKGSFLQFCRAVPSPTVLNHKVKQREDETCFHKSTKPQQSREQEVSSETCDTEESSSVPSELKLQLMPDQCKSFDHIRLVVEDSHLQEQLSRCQAYGAFEEREAMVQDISNLRKKLLAILDRNISIDAAAAHPQQEALVAELVAERQIVEHLQNEVESHQRGLSECRMKLQNSLEFNERIARDLDALRLKLESAQEECRRHKQDFATLQLKKALEVNCLELKQAQHQNVVLDLKTQLQKSEEKAEQETIKRNRIELRLQEALQESNNLQTELQWTRDSLERAEAFVETLQRNEPVLEIGDPEASYEAFMVEQLQAEIIEMHARLEDERRHGSELEDQIKAEKGNLQDLPYKCIYNCPKHDVSTEDPCYAKERRKVKHHEAILQLQMELASIDGSSSEAKVSRDCLRQQLNLNQSKPLNEEKGLNAVDSLADPKGYGKDHKSSNQEDGKCLSKLQEEWEGAALRMFDRLSLLAAAPESKQDVAKHNNTELFLKERLLHAQVLANSADKKLRVVNDLMVNSMASWPDAWNIMEVVLQTFQNLKVTKKNLEDCNTNLGEIGQKSAVSSILVWWMSETATFRHEASSVTWDDRIRQLEAEKEVLELQVQSNIDAMENILLELSYTEAQVQEAVEKTEGESMAQKQTVIARDQALVAAVAEAEQRCTVAEAARLKLEEELGKHLEAAHDLQLQIEMKEEEICKLEEQVAAEQANWVLKNSELTNALRESEERCDEKNQIITNLQKMLASLKNLEDETVMVEDRLETSSTTENARELNLKKDLEPGFAACSEDNWINAVSRDKFTITSKIVMLQSIHEGYPSGNAKVELTRTQLLLTGSEGKVKLLSEMVAKIRKNRSDNRSEAGSINEKLETLSVLPKQEQDCTLLKAMLFSLDKENADLQHQLLQMEADSIALKSAIVNLQSELQDSSQQRSEEVTALVSQLHVSDRHIFKLECQSVELRDAMQRQAVAFGALYEQLQKQESSQMLEEEKTELIACRKKAEKYQSKLRKLKSQVESLHQELERMEPLRKEIVLIYEELHASRSSAEIAAEETERLRSLVEDLEWSRNQLQEEVKRKQCAIEALEEHLLKSQQSKLQCQEELHLCEQKAEVNKTRAQEKQVEVEILGKSVEELENTVYALESQVGLLKRESEMQCLVREDMERKLQGLEKQNVNLHAALSQKNSAAGNELRREFKTERKLREREAEIQLRKKLEKYQIGSEEDNSFPQPQNIQKDKKQPKGSIGSAFRWFKLNHQVHSELHEERKAYERRIQELEDALGNRHNEVILLTEKLADAERVTHDVLRVQRDFEANCATLAERQKVEDAHEMSDKQKLHKDEEVERILAQLNSFIEERESWLEVIDRKQAELTAIQAAMEKLQERETSLVAENKKFKNENRMLVKKMGQLEQDIKTLSAQQSKHHVKIKDDNNALRIQNNDLSAKLRRVEHVNTRISDELAKYRIAQGRQPLLNIEEEQRLRSKLQEAQEQSSQVAQKLASFSASVMKATGLVFVGNNHTDTSLQALEALEQMNARLKSTQLELDDCKLKTRIVEERQRLSEMRTTQHSLVRDIDSQSLKSR